MSNYSQEVNEAIQDFDQFLGARKHPAPEPEKSKLTLAADFNGWPELFKDLRAKTPQERLDVIRRVRGSTQEILNKYEDLTWLYWRKPERTFIFGELEDKAKELQDVLEKYKENYQSRNLRKHMESARLRYVLLEFDSSETQHLSEEDSELPRELLDPDIMLKLLEYFRGKIKVAEKIMPKQNKKTETLFFQFAAQVYGATYDGIKDAGSEGHLKQGSNRYRTGLEDIDEKGWGRTERRRVDVVKQMLSILDLNQSRGAIEKHLKVDSDRLTTVPEDAAIGIGETPIETVESFNEQIQKLENQIEEIEARKQSDSE